MRDTITPSRRALTPFGVAWVVATCLATWALVAAGSAAADGTRAPVEMQGTASQR
jgi:hypothetical protein